MVNGLKNSTLRKSDFWGGIVFAVRTSCAHPLSLSLSLSLSLVHVSLPHTHTHTHTHTRIYKHTHTCHSHDVWVLIESDLWV